jgi:uncharacterized membrane protein
MPAGETRTTRRLTFASLALNLFLVGVGGALVVRHYSSPAVTTAVPVDRSVAGRIGRIAATLPTADADILRTAFRVDGAKVEAAQAALRQAQDAVGRTLRAEPFEIEATRAAMADTRAARHRFDQELYDLMAAAAGRMSPAGRSKLADWPGTRSSSTGETAKQ